ncbi:TBC1 domain family member 15-like [Senna tora]|uniref:TBC1 domain family member 15-like n=1 Tax=Senna tora TaxID=362788 RepID=A0A834WWX9_9FABA|nr:TBC1 domain family member 15-like [Senna tora]
MFKGSGSGCGQEYRSQQALLWFLLFFLLTTFWCFGMWRDSGAPADSYYEIRPECTDVPKTRFKIKAGKTLSVRKWQAAFTPEGYLDIGKTLSRIQRGGIHPTIRGEVWEFLLGCYDPNSSSEEREQIRQRRRVQYNTWKELCHQLFPLVGSGRFITAPVITEDGQPILDPLVLLETNPEKGAVIPPPDNIGGGVSTDAANNLEKVTDKRIIQWMLTLHQIGLDVLRTDRTLVFYEKQENLSKLWDILAVYAWIDTDVGYCQGMSDLCSPMIILLDDEADAFWCFERLMRRLRGNFRCTDSSVGVEAQLSNLAAITQVIDPKLHQHLEHLGGGDYLFAFRMLMVLFRREFSFCDSLYLWEMMWALEYDPDLFMMYEDDSDSERSEESKRKAKSKSQCGKFERENLKNGANEAPLPISVFLVASVLKDKSAKLLTEARGLDDVVKILNDMTGNLDAKKACTGAMKLHKKYLKKEEGEGEKRKQENGGRLAMMSKALLNWNIRRKFALLPIEVDLGGESVFPDVKILNILFIESHHGLLLSGHPWVIGLAPILLPDQVVHVLQPIEEYSIQALNSSAIEGEHLLEIGLPGYWKVLDSRPRLRLRGSVVEWDQKSLRRDYRVVVVGREGDAATGLLGLGLGYIAHHLPAGNSQCDCLKPTSVRELLGVHTDGRPTFVLWVEDAVDFPLHGRGDGGAEIVVRRHLHDVDLEDGVRAGGIQGGGALIPIVLQPNSLGHRIGSCSQPKLRAFHLNPNRHLVKITSRINCRLQVRHWVACQSGPIPHRRREVAGVDEDGAIRRHQNLSVMEPNEHIPRLQLLFPDVGQGCLCLKRPCLIRYVLHVREFLRPSLKRVRQEDSVARVQPFWFRLFVFAVVVVVLCLSVTSTNEKKQE